MRKTEQRETYLPIPTIFLAAFLLMGLVLDLAIQLTGDSFLFHSLVDRAIYLVYEPAAFILTGTILGLLFLLVLRLAEVVLLHLRFYRDARDRRRISIGVFFIISLTGAFLFNSVLIQGGYRIGVWQSIGSILIALALAMAVSRFHRLFLVKSLSRIKRIHGVAFLLSLLVVVLVRIWVGTEGPHPALAVPAIDRGRVSISREPGDFDQSGENVIIVLQDALRADHLSLYGYERRTSPDIDRWARSEGSIVFSSAFTPKTKTSPAVASLFTGLYPQSHGIYYCAQRLDRSLTTLAELLQENGYGTASFVGNANASECFDFDQGFDTLQREFPGGKPSAEQITSAAIEWLEKVRKQEKDPFFLYLHYIDTHTPYDPPEEYRSLFLDDEYAGRFRDLEVTVGTSFLEHIRDEVVIEGHETDIDYYVSMYDSEIRYFDDQFDRFLAYLSESGLAEGTLLILTADHGESLTEHNYYFAHGSFAYEPTARLPLVIHHESFGEPRWSDAMVSLADLAPTIIDFLGLETEQQFDGVSLVPIMRKAISAGPEYMYVLGGDRHEWVILHAITDGRWKLIYNPLGLSRQGLYNLFNTFYPRFKVEWLRRKPAFRDALLEYQLYDLASDPGEERNLITSHPEEAERLKQVLFTRYYRDVSDVHRLDVEASSLDEATIENLRALGYIQ